MNNSRIFTKLVQRYKKINVRNIIIVLIIQKNVCVSYISKVGFTSEIKEKYFFSLHFARFSLPLQPNKETNYEEIISITWNSASPCRNDRL